VLTFHEFARVKAAFYAQVFQERNLQMSTRPNRQAGKWQIGDTSFPRVGYLLPILLVMCLMLAGCTSPLSGLLPTGTRPLVKVGLAAPFEGLDRPLGYEALSGAKLALAERNAAGGVGDHMVELVALNDFGESGEAHLQATEFAVDPAVMGVVTGWTAETAHASLPVYQQMDMAVAVPWSVPPELAHRESGIVLVAADTRHVAGVLAEAVAASHPDRLVVLGGEPSAALYAESMQALGLRVEMIPPPGALTGKIADDWATRLVLSRVRPPDVLVLATDGALASEVLLMLVTRNWAGTVFGGVEVGSVHLVNVAGDAATGLAFVSPSPAGRDLVSQSGGGDLPVGSETLSPRAVLAYDAMNVLLDAIELAVQRDGYPSRHGVAVALPTVQRHGLTGAIAFDVTGRRVDAPVWIYSIGHEDYPGQMLLSPLAAGSE
jgi:branched-chain amino acid transport system substrate-binding protein